MYTSCSRLGTLIKGKIVDLLAVVVKWRHDFNTLMLTAGNLKISVVSFILIMHSPQVLQCAFDRIIAETDRISHHMKTLRQHSSSDIMSLPWLSNSFNHTLRTIQLKSRVKETETARATFKEINQKMINVKDKKETTNQEAVLTTEVKWVSCCVRLSCWRHKHSTMERRRQRDDRVTEKYIKQTEK